MPKVCVFTIANASSSSKMKRNLEIRVKTEEIRKGGILAGLRDIWRSFPYRNPLINAEKLDKI